MSYNEMKYGVRVRVRGEMGEKVRGVVAAVVEVAVGIVCLGGAVVMACLSGVMQ